MWVACALTPACWLGGWGVADVLTAPATVQRLMHDIKTWFRVYKVPDGKGENRFVEEGGNGGWVGRDRALQVIQGCHLQWRKLAISAAAPRIGESFGVEAARQGECCLGYVMSLCASAISWSCLLLSLQRFAKHPGLGATGKNARPSSIKKKPAWHSSEFNQRLTYGEHLPLVAN